MLLSYGLMASHPLQVCTDSAYKSIKEALEASVTGDTIDVLKGSYTVGNIFINKSVTLRGIEMPEVISKSGDEVFTVTANNVTIDGFKISGVTTSYLKERSAIRLRKCKNFLVINNFINECFFGIYLEHVKEGVIKNNKIKGIPGAEAASGNAIHAWYCNNLRIEGNDVRGHRDGIYFEFVNESEVIKNHSEGNTRYGLHFMFSNDDIYNENVFNNNGVGVAVMFSRRIEMNYNKFSFNWGRASYGLLLKEIYDAEILHNKFEQNTIGIFVEGSNRVNYLHNDFSRNGWAIKFAGGCETNIVSQNNFINNSLDLVMNTQLNDNLFEENYWSSYSGYDLDKDKIGDIPHYPVKLYSFILENTPEAIILMRSLFVDLINYSEKVSPVFTPKLIMDKKPLMFEVDDTY